MTEQRINQTNRKPKNKFLYSFFCPPNTNLDYQTLVDEWLAMFSKSNEGGVAAGFGSLDSPLLVDMLPTRSPS
jgi:hypothetical protein